MHSPIIYLITHISVHAVHSFKDHIIYSHIHANVFTELFNVTHIYYKITLYIYEFD